MKAILMFALFCVLSAPAMAQESVTIQGPARQEIGTIKPSGVSLNYDSLYVFAGDKPRLTATVTPGEAFNKQVTWESSDSRIASVDAQGNITPLAEGTAVIKAVTKDGGMSASCTVEVDIKNLYGNTSGNVSNRGFVASQGRWVYYANPGDGMRLYKIRKDGTDKTKLSDDRASYINVIGHGLYYVSESQGGMLYSININGSRRTCLNDVDKSVRNAQVYGSWIYYLTRDGEIYLISISGDNRSKLGNESGVNMFTLADTLIYFSKDSGIYKIRRNGGDKKELVLSAATSYPIWDREVLYYRIDNHSIARRIKAGDAIRYKNISTRGTYTVSDGWIYYLAHPETDQLRKISVGGSSDQTLISKDGIYLILGADDWVYYYTGAYNKPEALYKIRRDGLKNQRLE